MGWQKEKRGKRNWWAPAEALNIGEVQSYGGSLHSWPGINSIKYDGVEGILFLTDEGRTKGTKRHVV